MSELTIILPVQNMADSISGRLKKLLDVASSLTQHFEIIVVVDGSSDSTGEMVAELCCEFPQVRRKQHNERRGLYASIRSGCALAESKTVFVQHPTQAISPDAITRFWNSKAPNNLLEISDLQPIRAVDDQLIGRLTDWCSALKKEKAEQLKIDRTKRLDEAEKTASSPNLLSASDPQVEMPNSTTLD